MAAWYSLAWKYRVKVTFDNTGGPTWTSGPRLVRLRSEFPGWASVKSDLSDLRVTDSDGTTLLNWWVAPGYSVAGNTANLYVNVTVASNSTGTAYVYYGNAAASDASSYSNTMSKMLVFTANTLAAYQLDDGSGTTPADSSGNGNTAALVATPTWQSTDGGNYIVSSPVVSFASGSCILFNGTSQYMTCGTVLDTAPAAGTIAFWFKWAAVPSTDKRILSKWNKSDGTNYTGIDCYYHGADHTLHYLIYTGPTGATSHAAVTASASAVLNDTNWHHVALDWGAAGMRIIIDGALQASLASYTGTFSSSAGAQKPLTFAADNLNDGSGVIQFANAYYDCIVVENVQHDRGWVSGCTVRAKYEQDDIPSVATRSGSNPIIVHTTEQSSGSTAVLEPSPFLSADGTTVNLYYTSFNGTHSVIVKAHTAVASFPTGWTKDGTVVGNGTGGESNDAQRPYLYTEDGTNLTLFYADNAAGGNLRYLASTDGGSTWAAPATLISTATVAAAIANATGCDNCRILKVGATYELLLEVRFSSGASGRMTRWTMATVTGTPTYQATLTALQTGTGSQIWSIGPAARYNGVYRMLYHSTPASGAATLPSYLFSAILDGAITADSSWVQDSNNPQYVPTTADVPSNADPVTVWQVADNYWLQLTTGGVTTSYVLYDGDDNGAAYKAQINVLSYAGTLAELFDGRNVPSLAAAAEAAPFASPILLAHL